MTGRRREFSPPAVGGSSLLVIFAVLCLTVFAMLCLATVSADRRLSQRSAQSVAEYYAADTEAETILAALRAGSVPEGVARQGDTYAYAVPLSDSRELRVEVRLTAEGDCTVLRWQTVSTADWNAEDTLSVWDGEEPQS